MLNASGKRFFVKMNNYPIPNELPPCAEGITSDAMMQSLDELPLRIRNIAMLRGLGYTFREIGEEIGVSPQAISLMLSRHRRGLEKLQGAVEFKELSSRAVNALGLHGIRSREQARDANVLHLLGKQRNCGKKTLEEIERWMHEKPSGDSDGPGANFGGVSRERIQSGRDGGDVHHAFQDQGLAAVGAAS